MDDTYRRIMQLRAIRDFDERPVDSVDLDQILEAARWTGSSKNSQNWSFIVVADPAQKERLLAAGDFTTPLARAPMGIAIVEEPGGYEFDTGRVAQNIMLAADAIGLVTCPVTLHHEEVSSDVLGIPTGARCRYAVAIGYPTSKSRPGKWGGRKPIQDLVHQDRYRTD